MVSPTSLSSGRSALHATVAYIRKYAPNADVQNSTKNDSADSMRPMREAIPPEFGHSYGECRVPALKCSICRLPVKRLGLKCSICQHRGHSDCYLQHYSPNHPANSRTHLLLQPPPQEAARRGRPLSRLSAIIVPDTPDPRAEEKDGVGAWAWDMGPPTPNPAPAHRASTTAVTDDECRFLQQDLIERVLGAGAVTQEEPLVQIRAQPTNRGAGLGVSTSLYPSPYL
ncbi:unnamed protein product [Peniophora sp. CBMAI 1063]|nr:unnamed protein product [Peniophora sp. CBMAI 1063]